ncbi:methyl-accepting chemotaxis protein [Methylibium petroleiphilum]|uniref:Methyl-accepting chemotaxis protein I n=1 Tax=Methylibium petroleiphilum (strain ATCC BAA-1232 / LMG 22953 / PM1) TaxID=420662 RepID=A2SCK8_METPP|nr:methyl-accepting chemotaxis protein [Methylibium petroleiphilum]ABM93297.1 methyl-accepting chemotaxis protein I [Methylibium petroleiphilum PM1]
MNLLNYRLTTRIAAGFTIMVVLTLALGALSVWNVRSATGEAYALLAAVNDPAVSTKLGDLQKNAQRTLWTIAGLVLATAVFGAWLGWAIRQSVRGPVEDVVASVSRIAAGDLATKISSSGRDEIAWLNHELNQMRKKLLSTIAQVRESAEQVSVASNEIASGNTDLSTRTETQASGLQQTASSMEQLTSTVRQNADNAQQANQLVVSASDVASRGGEVMTQVVSTMNDINSSARKIADIIGVIDGIAFQTNILALNAAVEAARAGEQGRGFAVVAGEVRNLAQRSAAAAKEIKTLIGDSVDKVETGTRLVDQAGSTMDEILASVRQVTHIMSEISVASREQSAGIEQVNRSIEQMDSSTQQNAALVEQAAAASHSLRDQSHKLTEAVKVFKLAA